MNSRLEHLRGSGLGFRNPTHYIVRWHCRVFPCLLTCEDLSSASVEALVVEGEGSGRSSGELSSKIHLATDGRGLPVSVVVTGGQTGDNPQLLPVLDGIRVDRTAPGRPRSRPQAVVADKAYSHASSRATMGRRKAQFISPEKADQTRHRATKGSRGGRPSGFDEELYRGRNVIKWCSKRLEQFRDLATRYAKCATCSRNEVLIDATVLWL